MTRKPKPYTADWYSERRDIDMLRARNWKAHHRNSGDPGCLAQMRAWVQTARRNNHAIIAIRRMENAV